MTVFVDFSGQFRVRGSSGRYEQVYVALLDVAAANAATGTVTSDAGVDVVVVFQQLVNKLGKSDKNLAVLRALRTSDGRCDFLGRLSCVLDPVVAVRSIGATHRRNVGFHSSGALTELALHCELNFAEQYSSLVREAAPVRAVRR